MIKCYRQSESFPSSKTLSFKKCLRKVVDRLILLKFLVGVRLAVLELLQSKDWAWNISLAYRILRHTRYIRLNTLQW
uniref:Uncharacterized protein n=1 Tax=Oryzias latipes TaxID=8090 RepID=A0A3B3HQ87_ORYLA